MPVNVAFYSDSLASGRYGLGRYARELLAALRRHAPEVRARPVSTHAGLDAAELARLTTDHGYVRVRPRRKFTAAVWTALGWPPLERWTPWADVVHCVELDYRVPTNRPLVVTVHDIGPLTHPEWFRASHPWLMRAALQSAARRAAAIICVSRATADAVEEFLGTALGDRLSVIPEGVSEEFFQPASPDALEKTRAFIQTGEPFFLWAGSLNPRKNVGRVVAAFEAVAARVPHHLVLVGGAGWDAEPLQRRIRASPVAARIHQPGRVSDAELRALYQRADAFVYVSLLEGFGLPILEAMAGGCPVITSDRSSMPEVAGDAACLVNPTDVDALAAALSRVATEPAFAPALAAKGRVRAAALRWDTCAAAVAKVYQRVSAGTCAINAPAHPKAQPLPLESPARTAC